MTLSKISLCFVSETTTSSVISFSISSSAPPEWSESMCVINSTSAFSPLAFRYGITVFSASPLGPPSTTAVNFSGICIIEASPCPASKKTISAGAVLFTTHCKTINAENAPIINLLAYFFVPNIRHAKIRIYIIITA